MQVLVLTSIRRPKRIIIRGDDEKDHMFLVKGGEDLRLDQRIEQVSRMKVTFIDPLINSYVDHNRHHTQSLPHIKTDVEYMAS